MVNGDFEVENFYCVLNFQSKNIFKKFLGIKYFSKFFKLKISEQSNIFSVISYADVLNVNIQLYHIRIQLHKKRHEKLMNETKNKRLKLV